MSGDHPFDADRELDVREIAGAPFGPIQDALSDLQPGETLLLVNSFEPEPLYGVLEERGFSHLTEQVADEEWHVAVEHGGDQRSGSDQRTT